MSEEKLCSHIQAVLNCLKENNVTVMSDGEPLEFS